MEDVAVGVSERGAEAVEARCRAGFELYLDALFECRRVVYVAAEETLARVDRFAAVAAAVVDIRHVGVGGVAQLGEGNLGAAEEAERHKLVVCLGNLRGVVEVVGVDRYGAAQHGVAQARAAVGVLDDVETVEIGRVDDVASCLLVSCARHGVVGGVDVDLADAEYGVVLPLCHAPLVVARKRRLHDHLHCRRVVGRERIDGVEYVVDREVVVAAVVQVARDALALVVQTRYVEHVAAVQQRRGGVGEDDRAQRLVAELVSYAVDAHRLALPDGVGHGDAAARQRVDAACHIGGEVSSRVEICSDVAHRLARLLHVEHDGRLSYLALEVVPPVVLVGVGEVVDPRVEVYAEDAFVGRLADVVVQLVGRAALVARCGGILLDLDLLQQILALGQLARDVAGCGREGRRGREGDMSYEEFHLFGQLRAFISSTKRCHACCSSVLSDTS